MTKEVEHALARADLCRFLAACYYQPGPEFTEDAIFDAMSAAAARIDDDLAASVQRLADAFAADSAQDLLLDYARLFLGPTDLLAKPYGSSWLTGEKTLMQDATMAVLDLYREGGFDIDESFRELPDHIAAELEFLYLLLHRTAAARHEGDRKAAETVETLRRRLIDEHLARWIAPFTAAMEEHAATRFYRELADLTRRVVNREAAATS